MIARVYRLDPVIVELSPPPAVARRNSSIIS